jgi:ribose-phosphate pyrophosphokinase
MEKVTTKKLALYSGRTHPDLAAEVARHLGTELGHPNIVEFANGEVRPRFAESVRGADVFIIQSHYGVDGRSVNDSIMEQLIMCDAAYRASAKRSSLTCSRPPARSGWSRSTSTPARSRASSTAPSTI